MAPTDHITDHITQHGASFAKHQSTTVTIGLNYFDNTTVHFVKYKLVITRNISNKEVRVDEVYIFIINRNNAILLNLFNCLS